MKQSCLLFTSITVLLISGCSSMTKMNDVSLQCKAPYKAGSFIGLYSFAKGDMTGCLKHPNNFPNPDQYIDLVYYFDNDDCSQGALIGWSDNTNSLFPIGNKSWSMLAKIAPPSQDSKSTQAINPLTKENEGFAFWVKLRAGQYILVRIKSIQPATYQDIASGKIPKIRFEWMLPQTSKAKSTGN